MADPKLVARANEVIDRLFALNEAMESAHAFCAYLKELNARDVLVKQYLVKPSDVGARPVLSIRWVHAGILRAAIGTITACLDPEDSRRGNRASIGQIIRLLKDKTLVDLFAGAGQESTVALQQARERYEALLKDDLFDRARRLRNDVAAHNLMPDNPTPKVHYEDVYDLRDAAERIVTDLFAACVRDKPNCLALRAGRTSKPSFSGIPMSAGPATLLGRLDRGDGDVPLPRFFPAIAVAVLPERHALPLRTPESAPDHGSTERGAGHEAMRLKIGRRGWPQRAGNWPPRTSASALV
jgi:hypothetical protein